MGEIRDRRDIFVNFVLVVLPLSCSPQLRRTPIVIYLVVSSLGTWSACSSFSWLVLVRSVNSPQPTTRSVFNHAVSRYREILPGDHLTTYWNNSLFRECTSLCEPLSKKVHDRTWQKKQYVRTEIGPKAEFWHPWQHFFRTPMVKLVCKPIPLEISLLKSISGMP